MMGVNMFASNTKMHVQPTNNLKVQSGKEGETGCEASVRKWILPERDTPSLRWDQIQQRMLVFNFVVSSNEKPTGLGASTTWEAHTSISEIPWSPDPGSNRSDLSDVVRITIRKSDAALLHIGKTSRIQIADIFVHISRHEKRWRITKLGMASSRYTRGRYSSNRHVVRQKAEEKYWQDKMWIIKTRGAPKTVTQLALYIIRIKPAFDGTWQN